MDDMAQFSTANKAKWKWMTMIMQPPPVTKGVLTTAVATVSKKKNLALWRSFDLRGSRKVVARRPSILAHSRKKGRLSSECISLSGLEKAS